VHEQPLRSLRRSIGTVLFLWESIGKAKQFIGFFIRSSLLMTSPVGEGDRNTGFDRKVHVLGELFAAIPRDALTQLVR
jgi:hypothetical protein